MPWPVRHSHGPQLETTTKGLERKELWRRQGMGETHLLKRTLMRKMGGWRLSIR